MHERTDFYSVKLPGGCTLRRKEIYEYVTRTGMYDIELFENQDQTFYAIALPRHEERVIVYGSSVVPSAEMALSTLILKIEQDCPSGLQDEKNDDDVVE